jgi:hypothetical protein
VPDADLTRVWVLFSERSPEFSAKIHSTTGTYAEGDIVYYPGTEVSGIFPHRGECYRAELDENGAQQWTFIEFPAAIHAFVVNKAAADMLRHYGQKELATTYDASAERELVQEWDKVNTEAYQKVIENF